MPAALLKQCTGPGCSNLTEKSPCPECSSKRERWRGTRQERGYGAQWDRDARHFRQLFPYCGMRPNDEPPVMSRCHELGIVTPAYQTDHVVPHRGNPALFMDKRQPIAQQPNWQSLCRECGARKSAVGL